MKRKLFILFFKSEIIEFCKWSKKAEWADGETKRAFIDNDWSKYIDLFLTSPTK